MSEEWKHEDWVSTLGKLAWIFVLINGIVGIIYNIAMMSLELATYAFLPPWIPVQITFMYPWYLVWSIVVIIIGFAIIRPKFSKKCGEKDWDALYDWYLKLGSTKIPWMLIWGIILSGFSWWNWGGIFILIPAIVLLAAGPKKYEWK